MFAHFEALIAGGLIGVFGNPLFLAIFGLLIFISIGIVNRFKPDLMAAYGLSVVLVIGDGLIGDWFKYVFIIAAGAGFGLSVLRRLAR